MTCRTARLKSEMKVRIWGVLHDEAVRELFETQSDYSSSLPMLGALISHMLH